MDVRNWASSPAQLSLPHENRIPSIFTKPIQLNVLKLFLNRSYLQNKSQLSCIAVKAYLQIQPTVIIFFLIILPNTGNPSFTVLLYFSKTFMCSSTFLSRFPLFLLPKRPSSLSSPLSSLQSLPLLKIHLQGPNPHKVFQNPQIRINPFLPVFPQHCLCTSILMLISVCLKLIATTLLFPLDCESCLY